MTTIDIDTLAAILGAAGADYPGFTGCGPGYFSKGCIDGGMSLDEFLAISQGSRMMNGKKATFANWAGWMRDHHYPSSALDKAGWPKR